MSTTREKQRSGTKVIKVDYLARVEGEGGLHVKIRNNAVQDVKLQIFEPPRFFEGFLRGRFFTEAPDITARICGICPVAYQMSAAQAMEDICGIQIDESLRALRHLLYCAEWIESHVLHIYMLHAPDFLGFQDAIRMVKDHPEIVRQGLELKRIGNALMTLLGGREIHPVNPRVGGFYRVPSKDELESLVGPLKWARDAAYETVRFTSTLPYPDFEREYEYVALRHPEEYAILSGRIVSNRGLDISVSEFLDHIVEEHVSHSTSLHASIKSRGPYMVGPLARYNLNYDRLADVAREAAREAGIEGSCTNPFKSIIVRSIETLHACEVALEIIQNYEKPEQPAVEVPPRAGVGYGCTEAPRGILWHRYTIDGNGTILDARIIPPTAQNQRIMEDDLKNVADQFIDLPDEKLRWKLEQSVRNYDPCISCSCHFLDLQIDRE